jgi:DNA-directed RNA polymerase subunit RPC12/RpoP
MEHKCLRCGKNLKSDEIALYRKLIWREATEYLCIECLAKDLSSTPERLSELIVYFRTKQKCCLFT